MKTINDLHEKYTGIKALVLGNGISIKDYKPLPNTITIGVNDINKKFSPDYHLLVDVASRFSKERIANIHKSESNFFITQQNKGWDFDKDKQHFFKLGSYGAFTNLIFNEKLDYGLDSPYMAVLLAYKMGIKVIGLLGVDYKPGHFYDENDGEHQLVNVDRMHEVQRLYLILNDEMKKRKIQLFNLNKFSRMDSIPFLNINEFEKLKG